MHRGEAPSGIRHTLLISKPASLSAHEAYQGGTSLCFPAAGPPQDSASTYPLPPFIPSPPPPHLRPRVHPTLSNLPPLSWCPFPPFPLPLLSFQSFAASHSLEELRTPEEAEAAAAEVAAAAAAALKAVETPAAAEGEGEGKKEEGGEEPAGDAAEGAEKKEEEGGEKTSGEAEGAAEGDKAAEEGAEGAGEGAVTADMAAAAYAAATGAAAGAAEAAAGSEATDASATAAGAAAAAVPIKSEAQQLAEYVGVREALYRASKERDSKIREYEVRPRAGTPNGWMEG